MSISGLKHPTWEKKGKTRSKLVYEKPFYGRELRQKQKSSIKQLFTGGDVLAVLPTGFGKSIFFNF